MAQRWDAVVVGGGHNGLVAGALLGKEGRRVAVLEARPVVGGAAVTEQPWGPEFKVTALSYVMSLMPDAIVHGLDLARHGYHVYPMGPSYLGLPDGRGLVMGEETRRPLQHRGRVLEAGRRRAGALGRLDGRHRRRARPAADAGAAQAGLEAARRPARPAQGGLATAGARRDEGRRRHPALHDERGRPAAGVVRVRCRPGDDGRQRRDRDLGRARGTGHRLRDAAPLDRRRGCRVLARAVGLPPRRHGRGRRRHPPVGGVLRRDGAHRRAGRAGPHPGRPGHGCRPRGRRGAEHRHGDHRRAPADRLPPPPRRRGAPRRLRHRHPALAEPQRHGQGQPRAVGAARLHLPSGHPPAAPPHGRHRARPLAGVPRAGVPGGPQRPAGHAAVQRRLHPVDARSDAVPRGHARDEPLHAVGAVVMERRAPPGRARGLRRPGGGRLRRAGSEPGPVRDPPPGHRPVRHGAHLRPDRWEHLPR